MKLEIGRRVGQVHKPGIKDWRRNPADLEAACVAAAHYAKRDGVRMVVIPSTNYGRGVWRIASEKDSLVRYTTIKYQQTVHVVDLDGVVHEAVAEPSWPRNPMLDMEDP